MPENENNQLNDAREFDKLFTDDDIPELFTDDDIPTFKTTGEAIRFGEHATEKELDQLFQRRRNLLRQFDIFMAQDELDGASIVITQAQFCREAIEVRRKKRHTVWRCLCD